jgi:hypothetical protein
MAKKRKAKRASKSQGITINWGVIGLIVVIALLIGLWQMTDKSEADSGRWPQLMNNASATVFLDGDVNVSWQEYPLQPGYTVTGYRVVTQANGAAQPTNFDLSLSQVNTTTLTGKPGVLHYATVKDMAIVKAGYGTVRIEPIYMHAVYAPNSVNAPEAGQTVRTMLTY